MKISRAVWSSTPVIGQAVVPGNRFTSPHLDSLVADSDVRDALRQTDPFTSPR